MLLEQGTLYDKKRYVPKFIAGAPSRPTTYNGPASPLHWMPEEIALPYGLIA